jgi:hypothetical protein
MRRILFVAAMVVGALSIPLAAHAQGTVVPTDGAGAPGEKVIPLHARVFITPIENGFETYLAAALVKKDVPLTVVTIKEKADFEISGISDSEKAGWAKMAFFGSGQSKEQASIKVTNLKTGVVAFAYAVNKGSAARGKQSAAEACAKHLKDRMEGRE